MVIGKQTLRVYLGMFLICLFAFTTGMRENRGSEIVKELTGRDVPTILDPVFFLSKNEWLERIPNKREINEPYIFALQIESIIGMLLTV